MSRQLARQLFQHLRGATKTESIERLRRQGHRRVPVLRYTQIEGLVARAVEESLAGLGVGLKDEDLRDLNADARVRFLALAKQRDSLQDTVDTLQREQDELARHRDVLAGQLQRSEAALQQEEGGAPGAARDEEIVTLKSELGRRFGELLSESGSTELAEPLLALIGSVVDEHRQRVDERVAREQEARLTQLRRRIGKLRRKLEESEELLARARQASRVEIRPGAPPEAQPERAPADEKSRQALLDEIFQMNFDLQRMMGAVSDEPTEGRTE